MGLLRTKRRVATVGCLLLWVIVCAPHAVGASTANTVAQWNQIAEDAVVRSTPFQNEGLIYMADVSAAVYDAVVAIEGRYAPYRSGVTAPSGASSDAAVVEAAYRTLLKYLPAQAATLDPLYVGALAAIPDGPAKA